MITNVTQKDRTLHEIIDWCDAKRAALKEGPSSGIKSCIWDMGMIAAFHEVSKHCHSMLGYSGSMPLEVPNQSEDTKD